MRLYLFFIPQLMLIPLLCHSAQVVWNHAIIENYKYGNAETSIMQIPYLSMSATRNGTALEIWAHADSNLESANTFVLAALGDVVNAAYIENRTEWFAYARYGYENDSASHSDYSITLSSDESVYLAFRVETDPGHVALAPLTYGWVEMGLDDTGDLSLIRSAWDWDGDPITVGATPEPVSGLLLFLGATLLALRRRRENGKMVTA